MGHLVPLCGGNSKWQSPPHIKNFIYHHLLAIFDSVMRSLLTNTLDLLKSKKNKQTNKKKQQSKKLDVPLSFWTLSWLDVRSRTAVTISISAWECNQHHPDESRGKRIQKMWSWSFWSQLLLKTALSLNF